MKTNWLIISIICSLSLGFITACGNKTNPSEIPENFQELTVKVQGMTCGGCAKKLQNNLKDEPGVYKVDVSFKEGKVTFIYDPAATNPDTLKNKICSNKKYTVE